MSIPNITFNVPEGSQAAKNLQSIRASKKQMLDDSANVAARAKTDIHLTLQQASDQAKGVKPAKVVPYGVANKDVFVKINPEVAKAVETTKAAEKQAAEQAKDAAENGAKGILNTIKKHPVVTTIVVAVPLIAAGVAYVQKQKQAQGNAKKA